MSDPNRTSIRFPHPFLRDALQANADHHGISLNALQVELAVFYLLHTKHTRPFGRAYDALSPQERIDFLEKLSTSVIENGGINPKAGADSFQRMVERHALEISLGEKTDAFSGAIAEFMGQE